jgi:ribokinase
MEKPGSIVVIGSCNTDMVIAADRLPGPGETLLGGKFLMNPGGKGANQAVAAARLGGRVRFMAKIGNDLFGQEYLNHLHSSAINTDYVLTDPDYPSGVALITVDKSGENTIVVAPGANESLSVSDIDHAERLLEDCDILLMQLEIPLETVEYAATKAFEKGIRVVLNPAPAAPLPDNLIKKLFLVIVNRTEAGLLSGMEVKDATHAFLAAEAIRRRGVSIVMVTLGSDGVVVAHPDGPDFIPAVHVEAVDATAAGDTFCAAVCVGLLEGMPIRQAAELAVRAAAITVTRHGAQAAIPYRHEI